MLSWAECTLLLQDLVASCAKFQIRSKSPFKPDALQVLLLGQFEVAELSANEITPTIF